MLFRKTLDQILFCLLCLIPPIGLITLDEAIYPYVTPKYFFFSATIFAAFAFWICQITFSPSLRPRLSKQLISFVVFLLIVFVADVFGANFTNSFWSNYSRMEGFFPLLLFLLFFLMLNSSVRNMSRWNAYWAVHILMSVVIFGVAVLQKFEIMRPVDLNRVDSVFGNSSYLAIYASTIFFLCFFLYSFLRTKWMRAFIVFAAICNLGSIYLSQTRSATLGVLIGSGFLLFAVSQNKKKALASIFGVFGLFVISVFIFKSKMTNSTNLFDRISQMSFQEGSSLQARLAIWDYCVRAIVDQPWLGWGQENFSYLGKFYQPELWTTPWVDRSHNLFLEWGINAGLFGVIALGTLLFYLVRGIYQADSTRLSGTQKAALLSALLCWFINQFLSIDFYSLSVIFYSVLAFVHHLQFPPALPAADEKVSWGGPALLCFLFLFIGVYANYEINFRSFSTNHDLRQASKLEVLLAEATSGKPFRSSFQDLLNRATRAEDKDVLTFMIQSAFVLQTQSRQRPELLEYLKFFYGITEVQVRHQLQEDPANLFFKHLAATFYTQFADFRTAEKLFDELVEKVPRQQFFLIDQANLKLTEGRSAEGLRLYQRAYDLDPHFPMAKMFLALGYIYNRQFAEGNKLTNELMDEKRYEVYDERLINAYLATDQKRKVEEIMIYKEQVFGAEAQ